MLHCQPARICRIPALFAALIAIGVVATPRESAADTSVWAAGHLANLTTLRSGGVLGPGAQVGVNIGLNDFFALTVDGIASYHFANEEAEIDASRVFGLAAGLQYNFDIFKYVPFAGVAATAYLDAPLVASVSANAGAKLFLGVDWRFHRFWSVGLRGELHALLTDLNTFPVYTLIGLSASYHFKF